jgi:F-type H+-transporting ATPase subunit epsilon
MSLTLRVLAPDQSVFDGSADEVILPSTTGQVGILPGHVSLLAALDVGVLRVRTNNDWQSIALMGGFAEIESDDVTVLVNSAELGVNIDSTSAESDLSAARTAVTKLEGQPSSPEKVKAQQLFERARARAQASKPT